MIEQETKRKKFVFLDPNYYYSLEKQINYFILVVFVSEDLMGTKVKIL